MSKKKKPKRKVVVHIPPYSESVRREFFRQQDERAEQRRLQDLEEIQNREK